MLKNRALVFLIGLLSVMAVVAAALAFFWGLNTREYRRLQIRATYINNQRAKAQAVVNEAMEYSKHNPAIDPILQSVGAKPRPAAAPAAPAPKGK